MAPVAEHRLFACVLGSGDVTVLLDSGMREDSRAWSTVTTELAAIARVVTYDRAGLGQSDTGPAPRTVTAMAEDMKALLDAVAPDGPLVLVGHSAGGWRVRRFAELYPDRVRGLLLLDAPHEDFEAFRLSTLDEAERAERAAALAASRSALARGHQLEYEGLEDVGEELTDELPTVPLIVVSAGQHAWVPEDRAEAHERGWMRLQRALAALSPDGRLVVAADAGHGIQRDDPQLVVDLVTELVQGATMDPGRGVRMIHPDPGSP